MHWAVWLNQFLYGWVVRRNPWRAHWQQRTWNYCELVQIAFCTLHGLCVTLRSVLIQCGLGSLLGADDRFQNLRISPVTLNYDRWELCQACCMKMQISDGMFTMCNVRSQPYSYSQMYHAYYEHCRHRHYRHEYWEVIGMNFSKTYYRAFL